MNGFHTYRLKSPLCAHIGLAGFIGNDELCNMFLKYVRRTFKSDGNPIERKYYRLTESYRDSNGKTRQHMILALGYLSELPTCKQRSLFVDCLNSMVLHNERMICTDEAVSKKVEETYEELQSRGLVTKIISNHNDVKKAEASRLEEERRHGYVTVNEFFGQKITGSRTVGMENVCLSILDKLGLEDCLIRNGLTPAEARLAKAQVAARVIFPCSEYRTASYLRNDSSLCEMSGVNAAKITKDKLYDSARRLYELHKPIEDWLHERVVSMFNLKEDIYLLDLSNTYFEGRYTLSELLARGRSKEKRTDCKQVVFGAVVNTDGLLVRTKIFEGNKADYKCMKPMIEALSDNFKKNEIVIVMDAGMSGVENIKWLKENNYKFITVMRGDNKCTKVSDRIVTVKDEKQQDIKLRIVTLDRKPSDNVKTVEPDDYTGDTFMLVDSYAKAKKEQSMDERLDSLYVEGLNAIKEGIKKKGGTKKRDRVQERLGRLDQRTGIAHLFYNVKITYDKDKATDMTWERNEERAKARAGFHGKYIIRTNMKVTDEQTFWSYYNIIRTVETTFRILKSDLDIRPVFHKSDDGIRAHLHLAILAYWVVSTARYMLRKGGIKKDWLSLAPVMNKQVVVTCTTKLSNGNYVSVRKCSEPEEDLIKIYDTLKVDHIPIKTRKFVWTQIPDFLKNDTWKSGS